MKNIYSKGFSEFIMYANIFFPINLSLFSRIFFKSRMSFNFCFWLELISNYISIKVGIRTNAFYAVFFNHKLIYTLNSNSSNCKFISYFRFIFIEFTSFISSSRPPFITIVIFFNSPPIHTILSAKSSIIGFYTKTIHKC